MPVLFKDVNILTDETLKKHRAPGADFDEVTYADDTICITTSEEALNLLVSNMGREGNHME